MKKIVLSGLLLLLCGISFQYKDDIYALFNKKETISLTNNLYARNYNYDYVELTNNFSPNNLKDIYNIYYTILNSGMNKFTFYCKKEYKDCLKDVKATSNDMKTLSNINNFVHPYNSFHNIETKYTNSGKINIIVKKFYNNTEILAINKKVDEIINNVIKDETDKNKQIKLIHDYIINNSKYDLLRADNNLIKYKSDKAYGTLLEGYGICGGYADAAFILLDKLKIENVKISSENHVWNLVHLNDSWLHLDLTWDDPIDANSDKDVLEYNFFLITNQELEEINTTQHVFDKQVYNF